MVSSTLEASDSAELLRKLAASWIRTGESGEGLRTDEYVTGHRQAIMDTYWSCGKRLVEYLDYQEMRNAKLNAGSK